MDGSRPPPRPARHPSAHGGEPCQASSGRTSHECPGGFGGAGIRGAGLQRKEVCKRRVICPRPAGLGSTLAAGHQPLLDQAPEPPAPSQASLAAPCAGIGEAQAPRGGRAGDVLGGTWPSPSLPTRGRLPDLKWGAAGAAMAKATQSWGRCRSKAAEQLGERSVCRCCSFPSAFEH